jgi:LacI family transcriptional regulator
MKIRLQIFSFFSEKCWQVADKNKQKPGIVAVAKAAKVSPSTVSRSFNHPELVKPATRKKIDSVVRRLGYIRNRAAPTIHGIRSATIGLIVPTIDHAIFAEMVQSFSETVDEKGFTILLATHGYDIQREYHVLRKLLEHRVDGVAMVGTNHAQETFDLLAQNETPSISLWNFDPETSVPCVGVNNAEAGRLIAEHVLEQGHRDVALVFPPLGDNDRAIGRFEGVRQVLQAAHINVCDEWVLSAPYNLSIAKSRALPLLEGPARPSAVICGNDVIARGVISCATSLGLNVPGDISISGIGDFRAYQDLEPSLTTVRLPARFIGSTAGEKLSSAIIEREPVTSLCCDLELMIRSSVRRIR